MPPLRGPGYLIEYLFEIGPTMAAGMGAGPLTYLEILAWMVVTWTWLWPREVRLLRRLSREYLNESQHGTGKAPWSPEEMPLPTDAQRAFRDLSKL